MKKKPVSNRNYKKPPLAIEKHILLIRGAKVLLDADLATLYGVETKVLTRAVIRNIDRFPDDFMFQLTNQELAILRRQYGTSKQWGGRRYPPYAFTEQGVAMLSGVLRSKCAVEVNIQIMRTFVRLRQMLIDNEKLARQLAMLEARYDDQFKIVFDAIRQLKCACGTILSLGSRLRGNDEGRGPPRADGITARVPHFPPSFRGRVCGARNPV